MVDLKRNLIWACSSLACYAVAYGLCRFAFFDLHGMKQWPNILAIFGLIVLFLTLVLKKRVLTIMTIAGYMGGFVFGMLFNTYSFDQGGGRLNNAWKIWTISFIIMICLGIIWEIVRQRKK